VRLLAECGEDVCARCVLAMRAGDTGALLQLLAVLRQARRSEEGVCASLLPGSELTASWHAGVEKISDACVTCLEAVVEGMKSESAPSLPPDGTVHQHTCTTSTLLHHLLRHTDVLAPLLHRDAALCQAACVRVLPGQLLSKEQGDALVAAYFKRVLSQLGLCLVQRSEAYQDPCLRAVFRLNNYNYLLGTLLSSSVISSLELVEPHARRHYADLITQQKKIYSQSWSGVMHHLVGTEEVPEGQPLRDRDRQALKDRFSGFNKEIEEMQRAQRSYSLPDRKLRQSIRRDNKEYVLPHYTAFYDRYSKCPFSRNPDKYVKYSPAEVASLMDNFFDVAA